MRTPERPAECSPSHTVGPRTPDPSLPSRWQALGPSYVVELLCLFLGSRTSELRALGVSLTHMLAGNLNR